MENDSVRLKAEATSDYITSIARACEIANKSNVDIELDIYGIRISVSPKSRDLDLLEIYRLKKELEKIKVE